MRHVEPVIIDGLPEDAPELVLSGLLDEYRGRRERRFANATARGRAAAGLLVVGLQQRLLSSIEAFAISLAKHRKTVERQWKENAGVSPGRPKTPSGSALDKGLEDGFLVALGADAEAGYAHDLDMEDDAALRADADSAEESSFVHSRCTASELRRRKGWP